MFKNRYFQIFTLIIFVLVFVVFIYVFKSENSLDLNSFINPKINIEKVSEYIDQGTTLIQEQHEIQLGFLGNMYLNRIQNNQILVGNETLNSVELEFLVNSNNRIKTLTLVVVQPFWNDETELLYPDNASKLFEKSKYYSLTFANFSQELSEDEKTEYCIRGQNYKASSLEQCISQISFLDNKSNENIESFMNNDQSSIKIEGLWLLKAIDQSRINLTKSIQQ